MRALSARADDVCAPVTGENALHTVRPEKKAPFRLANMLSPRFRQYAGKGWVYGRERENKAHMRNGMSGQKQKC